MLAYYLDEVKTMKNFHTPSTDRLLTTLINMGTLEECYKFFEDLCTVKELQDMAQRFETAILLDKGESYISISKKVGISTATISRVNRCLTYGDGGYKNAIKILEKAEKNNADQ